MRDGCAARQRARPCALLSTTPAGADGRLLHPPLCMVLHTCCRQQPERLAALCGESGLQLVRQLLVASADLLCSSREAADGKAEWLVLLLGEACACARRFAVLVCALREQEGSVPHAAASEQGLLLHAVADAIEISQGVSPEEGHPAVRHCAEHQPCALV